jgi:uncharacterized protein YhhL (DUF1145 family)
MFKHHLITVAMFAGSVALSAVGMHTSAVLAMILGGVFELVAWKRLVKSRRSA